MQVRILVIGGLAVVCPHSSGAGCVGLLFGMLSGLTIGPLSCLSWDFLHTGLDIWGSLTPAEWVNQRRRAAAKFWSRSKLEGAQPFRLTGVGSTTFS